MSRSIWLSIIALAAFACAGRAVIILAIKDPIDDHTLVRAVSGQKPVKAFAAEIKTLEKALLAHNEEKIEKILGEPVPRPRKDFAIPVAQHRMYTISGIRSGDERLNNDHAAYYPIGDFAGIEIRYGVDGRTPQFAVLYFKVDGAFPRLKKVDEKGGEKPSDPKNQPAAIRRHTIDVDHWDRMKEGMNKEQVAELFSGPAGDYAPGTEYLTRACGWRRGGHGKVHETLEWRSDKGRITVDFDEKGNFITSEFFYPGRDPVTNVAERLKWDRQKFDKVKKYVEERMAAR